MKTGITGIVDESWSKDCVVTEFNVVDVHRDCEARLRADVSVLRWTFMRVWT